MKIALIASAFVIPPSIYLSMTPKEPDHRYGTNCHRLAHKFGFITLLNTSETYTWAKFGENDSCRALIRCTMCSKCFHAQKITEEVDPNNLSHIGHYFAGDYDFKSQWGSIDCWTSYDDLQNIPKY